MRLYISQTSLKHMYFLLLSLVMTSCDSSTSAHLNQLSKKSLTLPSGKKIEVFVAKTYKEQKKGLSGIKPKDFKDHQAMLFPFPKAIPRQFWMPDTHFNLDIIFMNKDYYILDIQRNLQHYPHKDKGNHVPRSKTVFSNHILEIKSSSPLAKEFQPGMILKFED